ncbi:DinB family protein [Henriciella aquimarina]|uniref:DinB family protein n=1 Tax=Henriciella aquimarina TaxID=545261 RepID=UPI000A01E544|nr:DinB family protein [Henriciella aquimarina]
MIGVEHPRLMARYNRWQNTSLYEAADTLSDAGRRKDRGGFFRSIHETLSHILWADQIWLSRFGACEAPDVGIADSPAFHADWTGMKAARQAMDETVLTWADSLDETTLASDLTWFSGAAQAEVSKPVWLLVTHIFNHQTHHRGQVHAMLTAAGAKPDDTDIFLMKDETFRSR